MPDMTEAALLGEVKLFSMLDEGERQILAGVVGRQSLPSGEVLFHDGEPGETLFVVRSGAVELFVKSHVGEKIVLRVAKAHDFFGELSLLDGGSRTATAVALEATELLVVDRDQLKDVFRKRPEAALDMLAAIGGMTRKADALLRAGAARNVNVEVEEKLTVVERTSDWIAWFSGSMYFLGMNTLWFVGWIVINESGLAPFDPYPFGLLTMIVSLEAIFLSIFVLISQNRQAAKDRVRGDIEYEVNVKGELEVAHLHEKTDRMREEMLTRFQRLEKALGVPPKFPSNAAVPTVPMPAEPPKR